MGNSSALKSTPSTKEVKKYKENYGVEITKTNNGLQYSGESSMIGKVKGMVEREAFLKEHRNKSSTKSKPNTLSSRLETLNFEKDYSRVSSSKTTDKNNMNSVITLTF